MTARDNYRDENGLRFREDSGLRFVEFLIAGIVVVTILLMIAVAIWGHFSAPDPGLI